MSIDTTIPVRKITYKGTELPLAEVAELEEKIAGFEEEQTDLRVEIRTLTEQKIQLEAEVAELEEQIVAFEEEQTDLRVEIRTLTQTNQSLQNQNEQLEAENTELEAQLPIKYNEGHADGVKSEYDRFWDSYQQNGNLTNYSGAFYGAGWNNETFKPKYDIKPSGSDSFSSIFRDTSITGNLKVILEDLGVVLDTSSATSLSYTFYNNLFESLPLIDMSNSKASAYVVARNSNLKRLEIKVSKTTAYNNVFSKDTALEELYITGTIGKNGFSVSDSPKLTYDSLMGIINALYDYSEDTSGTTWKVTLGATNKGKLTDEELQIAYSKNWAVA